MNNETKQNEVQGNGHQEKTPWLPHLDFSHARERGLSQDMGKPHAAELVQAEKDGHQTREHEGRKGQQQVPGALGSQEQLP